MQEKDKLLFVCNIMETTGTVPTRVKRILHDRVKTFLEKTSQNITVGDYISSAAAMRLIDDMEAYETEQAEQTQKELG